MEKAVFEKERRIAFPACLTMLFARISGAIAGYCDESTT
jgi:hypothetical protein